jgi:RNase adaptor protein for sRNA GlmZ degradation
MGQRVSIVSFGYLHGEPPQAHLTLDLRAHFRDPHVSPELRYLTAEDAAVREAVMSTPGIRAVVAAAVAVVAAYADAPAGDLPVVVATGCAGGRHRAATTALALHAIFSGDLATARELGVEDLAAPFAAQELRVDLVHRDLSRPVVAR